MADTPPPQRPASRALSELSENDDLRRASARVSSYSSTLSLKGGEQRLSRPGSQVGGDEPKRVSLPVHTITLNLADYTGSPTTTPKAAATTSASAVTVSAGPVSSSMVQAAASPPATPTPTAATVPLPTVDPPTSPTTKRKSEPPPKPEKPAELTSRPLVSSELVVDLSS